VLGAEDAEIIRARMSRAFPDLASHCEIKVIHNVVLPSDFIDVDAAVATLWVTCYALLRLTKIQHRYYFMQDFEPLFYPAGSTYALAEATYRLGFHGICNTFPLRQLYEQQGGTADHFLPAIDPGVFHRRGRPKRSSGEPFLLFNYSRPGHPRNCFEVISEGLRELKRRLKNRVKIITAGAEWDPNVYGLSGVVEHLGLLSYQDTGKLYRSIDAGVVAMATSHPSYIPFELMACGALVFTNRNVHTSWLLKDGDNCKLFELTKSAIADTIEQTLIDDDALDVITNRAARLIDDEFSNWDKSCETISTAILKTRTGPVQ
jgi:hypothetical protein